MFGHDAKIVYLITDGTLSDSTFTQKISSFLEKIRFAAQNGISIIQIREKNLSAKYLYRIAEKSLLAVDGAPTKIFINDRLDVALASGAHGVHLTSLSMNAAQNLEICRKFDAREKKFYISAAAHSFDECVQARDSGADMILLSPIFATPHKGAPLGLNYLAKVSRALENFPVIALGGIERQNAEQTLKAADGIAAIRLFSNAENIIAAGKIARHLD